MIGKYHYIASLLFVVLNIHAFSKNATAQETRPDSSTNLSYEDRSTRSLEERVNDLEKRFDKLDQIDVIKKVTEFLCPGGETYATLPDDLCPDGTPPQERITFKKVPFFRQGSLQDKIEEAIAEAESARLGVTGSSRGILQQVIGDKNTNGLFFTGSVDLIVVARPTPASTFFIDFEGIGHPIGPDETVDSLTHLNADAGTPNSIEFREVWLHTRFMRERLSLVAGKIDLTAYFDRNRVANDETEQFLNASLVSNPVLRQPSNNGGLVLQYQFGNGLQVGAGIQPSEQFNKSVEKLYAVVEIGSHTPFLSKGGNWSLWGRTLPVKGGESLGTGISLDQDLTQRVIGFARAGVEKIDGESKKPYAWSAGFQTNLTGTAANKDRLGLAWSHVVDLDRDEKIAEGYYNHFVTDQMNLSFDLQWLVSGKKSDGTLNENLIVPGFRTTINF